MTKPNEGITIRMATEADRPFILKSWANGLFFGNKEARVMDETASGAFGDVSHAIYMREIIPRHVAITEYAFRKLYVKLLDLRLGLPDTVTFVAALADSPDVTLGYVVAAPETIHWVYVKAPFRKMGIARALVCQLPSVKRCTHISRVGKSLLHSKMPEVSYEPF